MHNNLIAPQPTYMNHFLQIIDPWAKPSFGGSHSTKLFFEFRNLGKLPDKLIDVSSPVARGLTSFKVVMVKEGRRVIKTTDEINVPIGRKGFELTEIGYYVELSGLESPVLMGTRFLATLQFERAGSIEIEFIARFHSPKLARRIRQAAARGDIEMLRTLGSSLD